MSRPGRAARAPRAKSPAVLDGIGATAPFAGNGKWDPVGFTERTGTRSCCGTAPPSSNTRVAMLACAGWLVNQYELYFPGNLARNAFSSLGKNPSSVVGDAYGGKVRSSSRSASRSSTASSARTRSTSRAAARSRAARSSAPPRLAGRLGRQGPNIPFGPEDTDAKFHPQQNAGSTTAARR